MSRKHTPVVYNKLFEDGNYYITDQKTDTVGFERDSVIIHPCPHPNKRQPSNWPDIPFTLTMVLPHGEVERCSYCKQKPSEALVAVYKLQNFDHFASDTRDDQLPSMRGTHTGRFPRRNA